jgi:hypothetical protein
MDFLILEYVGARLAGCVAIAFQPQLDFKGFVQEAQLNALLSELRTYFGEAGYVWLSARCLTRIAWWRIKRIKIFLILRKTV